MSEHVNALPNGGWDPDEDDKDSVNDLFVKGCDVHLERMDGDMYWLGIYVDGKVISIDVTADDARITAFVCGVGQAESK